MRVVLAADGEEGLLRAQTSVPDALVLDLGLPASMAWTLCRQLREFGGTTGDIQAVGGRTDRRRRCR